MTAAGELAESVEAVVEGGPGSARAAANWVRNDLARELNERRAGLELAIAPARLAEIVRLVENGELSSSGARDLLGVIWTTGEGAREAMDRLGLAQVRDESQLAAWVNAVVRESPQQAAQFRAGRTQVLGYLVGQVMKRSAGRAEPRRVQELLTAALLEETTPGN